MAPPMPPPPPSLANQAAVTPARPTGRPDITAVGTTQETRSDSKSTTKSAKRKKPRQRKRRNRRQSFLATENSDVGPANAPTPETAGPPAPRTAERPSTRPGLPLYKLGSNMSNTSLESEALLDHRNQPMMRPRRESRLAQSFRPGSLATAIHVGDGTSRNLPSTVMTRHVGSDSDDSEALDDRTPLIRPSSGHASNVPRYGIESRPSPFSLRGRRTSTHTISSQCSPREHLNASPPSPDRDRDYDINNPPSMPSSPKLGQEMGYDDAVVTGADFDFLLARSLENRRGSPTRSHDMVIDMDGTDNRFTHSLSSSPPSPHLPSQEALRRRRTVALPVEEDVCFPIVEPSELAEEDAPRVSRDDGRRRRRHRQWPDLSVLEEWSREEKEERHGDLRAKKISEPMLVEGRLRPQYKLWRRQEDEAPYRFTYFNEEFQSTIHAQTISELVQPGGGFRELFIPDPPELEDSSSSEDDEDTPSEHPTGETGDNHHNNHFAGNGNGTTRATPSSTPANHPANHNGSRTPGSPNGRHQQQQQRRTRSIISEAMSDARMPGDTPALQSAQPPTSKPKRFGPRPTFWLDAFCPTDAEMRVIAKAFGIHALTAEDIMMQEAREKVELFRNYYFVNYRSFEQDPNSENYLQPVNMYVVVFREGVLSFHFSQSPHPANVRRRIRQLMDYLILSSDWISYALIDDITDVFGPLIQAIEDEVDEIDGNIMHMHSPGRGGKEEGDDVVPETPAPGEMLRRVGECRKKVMGMYRLLSNKADVVKGFAKRCNEQWEVAPKSEIGLYLGDIQDHIMTMTSSLTYYETILSRAHSNYLAQINILMNERQEKTADVLGRLTVLGTIVVPLNIIGSMWGMNVKVPGQEEDSLTWFACITGGMILFAIASFYIAKRVYKIV